MKKMIASIVLLTTIALQTMFSKNEAKNFASTASVYTSKDSISNKDPLHMITSAYLNFKNALTKDDEKAANIAANELFKAIEKFPATPLSKEQQTIWTKYSEKLTSDAEHIKNSNELEHQRKYFIELSKNIFLVIEAFKTNTITLYYQFCPMANEGKGAYWISKEPKINNPYFGKKMATCGSTKKTILATIK